jgi:hypothetical protein
VGAQNIFDYWFVFPFYDTYILMIDLKLKIRIKISNGDIILITALYTYDVFHHKKSFCLVIGGFCPS